MNNQINYDLAITISVYDKFDDVKLIVDLIRENWNGNFFIIVCSAHPNAKAELGNSKIDKIIELDNIPLDINNYSNEEFHLHFTLRVLDSIRTGCKTCVGVRSDYAMHIHADAYPLSWNKINDLIIDMKKRKKTLAARGDGWGFYSPKEPMGAFDDMFFLFDTKYAEKIRLWDFDLFDCLPHKLSIHGALAFFFLSRIGLSKFYHYASYDEGLYWDGLKVLSAPFNSARPMSYYPDNKFLHIHETDFPDDYGNQLKALYFFENGVTKGDFISDFLNKWLIDKNVLFKDLEKMEKKYKEKLKSAGLNPKNYGRNFFVMKKLLKDYNQLSFIGRLKSRLLSKKNNLKSKLLSLFKKSIQRRVSESSPHYHDTIWPKSLNKIYISLLNTNKYLPDELKTLYFDKNDSVKL